MRKADAAQVSPKAQMPKCDVRMAVDVHTPSTATDTRFLIHGQRAVKTEDCPSGCRRLRHRSRILEPEQARRDAEICSRLLLQKQLTVGFRACILHLEEPPLGRCICPARHTPILSDGSSFFNSFLCCFHPHPIEFVIDPFLSDRRLVLSNRLSAGRFGGAVCDSRQNDSTLFKRQMTILVCCTHTDTGFPAAVGHKSSVTLISTF